MKRKRSFLRTTDLTFNSHIVKNSFKKGKFAIEIIW